ncbi:TIGR00341 family protein [Patescibacteria group bacterium]|nr:TIGR00341 family protein [Patescibacteria group bacterium]
MKKINLWGVDFFGDVEKIQEKTILSKIRNNTHLSFVFLTLLFASAVICTLGLLINSTPIVIGGMIIAPMMWPLIQLSLGVSYGALKYIRQAVAVLLICVAITLISSVLIAFVSPIKQLNSEILSRTTPTLIDLVIALVAGGIAALAITQTRISESLAGVAIAVSLMPPLCVSGIGLAILDYSIFTGALLLFVSNVIAIVFTGAVVFMLVGLEEKQDKEEKKLRRKGLVVVAALLVLVGVWLYFSLRNYSFKIVAYNKVQEVLSGSFEEISFSIYIEGVKTELTGKDGNTVMVEAEVWLPSDMKIDYEQQQQIIEKLKDSLGKDIDLNLRLQNTISIVSEEDILRQSVKQKIEEAFLSEIDKINSALTVDLIEIYYIDESDLYEVDVVLRGDPAVAMTEEQRETLESVLKTQSGKEVLLNIEIISRVQLKSDPDVENERIKKEVRKLVEAISEEIDIASISLQNLLSVQVGEEEEATDILINLELKVPEEYELSADVFEYIKSQLQILFEKSFEIEVKLIKKTTYRF